ncbi:MAG: hypothetical protein KC444_03900 [Nitrosopumilus sp.]|nr:hypothetical protein [Nitrosopumilus sp.]
MNANFNARYDYKNNKQYSYKIILQDTLQQFANFIVDKKKELEFAIPKIHPSNKNTTLLSNKILGITPHQRKQMGISKSTLHYLKNNIIQGKQTRAYSKTLDKIQRL